MKKYLRHFTLLNFDRSFSRGLVSQLAWLVGIMLVVFIILAGISYIGEMYSGNGNENNRFLDILLVLIDPGSGSESMSSPLTIVCAILGLIVFSGMLISVISNVLDRRVDSYIKGENDYRICDHVVIIGFNKSIPTLLRTLDKKYPGTYLLIMCNRDIEEIRDWIHANIENSIEDKIILINGVRNACDDISRLRLNHGVKEIYILGEENESAHDAINMECTEIIAKKCEEYGIGGRIMCHIQLDSQAMFSALQKVDVDEFIRNTLIIQPFNFNEIWAQKALAIIPSNYYKCLDDKGIVENSDKHVHLIIIGMNPLSWALAVNAAHILHFPNFDDGDFTSCSTITFIDTEAKKKGKRFRNRYRDLFDLARWREIYDYQSMDFNEFWFDPIADEKSNSPYKHLGPVNFMDIQWEFIEGNVCDDSIQNYIEYIANKNNVIATIALCDEDSDTNASICLSMSEMTRIKAHEILVRQDESDIVIDTLRKAYGFENIRAFGMMNECYKENLISDKYGKLINASYKCTFDGSKEDSDKMDSSWNSSSLLDRWSSNYCANMLFLKLRSLGLDTTKRLTKAEIDEATSERNHKIIQSTEHNRWVTERLLLGMRPLYADEFEAWKINWADKTKDEMKPEKNTMKEKMKHIDICSNNTLFEIDKPAVSFDTTLNEKLSSIYELVCKDIDL